MTKFYVLFSKVGHSFLNDGVVSQKLAVLFSFGRQHLEINARFFLI